MFNKNLEKKLYEKEIASLKREVRKWMDKYELASQYQKEYEKLAAEYKEKTKRLEALTKSTKLLQKELDSVIRQLKNKKDGV